MVARGLGRGRGRGHIYGRWQRRLPLCQAAGGRTRVAAAEKAMLWQARPVLRHFQWQVPERQAAWPPYRQGLPVAAMCMPHYP